MLRAVVFDSDGTLLNSFEVIVGAYAYVAEQCGRPAPTPEMVREQLRHAPPLYQILETFFPGEDVDRMMRLNGEYVAGHAASVNAYADLHDLLRTLHDAGLKLAILTGGNHKINDLLQHHDIADYFASVVHCERVTRSKPDPEGFLLALKECGVDAHETIMVGDSPTDIFAGKNGGAAITIGITHGNGSCEDLVAADTDYIVDSLAELKILVKHLASKG